MPGGKPFQSKLVPHLEFIRSLRKKHIPYPEIAKRLHDEHGLKVAASTIFEFVKVRARRSGVYAIPEAQPGPAATITPPVINKRQPKKKTLLPESTGGDPLDLDGAGDGQAPAAEPQDNPFLIKRNKPPQR